MFITVDGFNRTGIPSALWNVMEPHARINHAGGVAVLSFVILFLSNVASNVPTGEPNRFPCLSSNDYDLRTTYFNNLNLHFNEK